MALLLTQFSNTYIKKDTKMFDAFIEKLCDNQISSHEEIEKHFSQILTFYSVLRVHGALLYYKPKHMLQFLTLCCRVHQVFRKLIQKDQYTIHLDMGNWRKLSEGNKNELISDKKIPQF